MVAVHTNKTAHNKNEAVPRQSEIASNRLKKNALMETNHIVQ